MRILLPILFTLMATFCMGCDDNNNAAVLGKPEARIEQFTLQCGDTYYRGSINESSKVISISGITNRAAITGVKCLLSGGATISPNPQDIERWEKEQKFTVTSSDSQAEEYILLLPELQNEPEPSVSKVVIGYLPANDWEYSTQFSNIHWEYLTHVNVSFALAKSDGTLNTDRVTTNIGQIRDKAHAEGVKVLISIAKNTAGEFTTAISNEETRNALAANIVQFTRNNQLDGFDIDYEEYDNWNVNFPSLLAFIQALYAAKDESMLMTCAVGSRWLTYTEEWQQYFDYINLMSYDNGSFTANPVQHSSYDDFVKDLAYWSDTNKTPKEKIVGGLPFYGYSWDEDVNKDEVRAVRYHGILEHFGNTEEVADSDVQSQTYYNGRPTIRKKCQYIMDEDFGGVMIWQLFQDAYEEDWKLINVVGEVIFQ